jgi:hypothetical protein
MIVTLLVSRTFQIYNTLFVKGAGRHATYELVWLDDILVVEFAQEEIAAVKELLGAVFAIRGRRRTSLGWR